MFRTTYQSLALVALAGLGAACSNPTVDPASTFTISGKALKADGTPLVAADVKLVRYFDKLKLLQPSVDALFACTAADCAGAQDAIELGVVTSKPAGSDGAFEFTVTGADIQARDGVTDAQGKVEVSNLVLVVVDPSDPNKKAGVYTFDKLFQQSDKSWGAGNLQLWGSDATADGANALDTGLVKFSWKAPPRPASSSVKNLYRVEASGRSSATLVVNCRDNVTVQGSMGKFTEGGCETAGDKLYFDVSLYALYSFYSDSGDFDGYVAAAGVDYRYRSRFTIIGPQLPDPRPARENAAIAGLWAVSNDTVAGQGEQSLLNTAAVDGSRTTKADISPAAKAIYVLFNGAVRVSDAGLFNAVVAEAAGSCVIVEFSTNGTMDIGVIKTMASGWEVAGRFCGATAAPTEMSAVLGFDSSAAGSQGRLGQWMRFRLADDANVDGSVSPTFTGIHEVGVYGRKI
jgi:hypothetical protein